MTVNSVKTLVGRYFFQPVSPYPAAIFRILFGLCVCATLLLLHSDWLNWFGVHGWITMDTISRAETGFRLNLFDLVPADDNWIVALYWLFLIASISMTLGLGTRLNSIIVFLGLNSLNQRMPLIFHGGDTFLRSAGFFMIFADSGAVLSIDSVMRSSQERPITQRARQISPWPLRLIQCQLVILYAASFCWKAKGAPWWNGTALFYVLHLREIRQFPMPRMFYDVWMLRLIGWGVMSFELLFPFLVWFKKFRIPMLLAGLSFHLGLEYALNIPMFQWDVLCAYVLFLGGLGVFGKGISKRYNRLVSKPVAQ